MTKKTDLVGRLISQVEPRCPLPKAPSSDRPLIESGMHSVLMRHMTERQADASLAKLSAAYDDWNELRVSQVQEIATHLKPGAGKRDADFLSKNTPAAQELKAFLQEVFQKTHGLDLEFWREDHEAVGKLVPQMPFLGMAGASYLYYLALGGELAVTPVLLRLLDRLELIRRTSSLKKGREMIQPLIPQDQALAFTLAFHEIADRWADPDAPSYDLYPALQDTAYGKKCHKERQNLILRQEAQRKRDEERRRKEDARRQREEERERKKIEASAKKKAAIVARRRAQEERKRQREEERRAREEAKRRAVEKKVKEKAAREAAAKKEAARKKVAAKKAAAKKQAAAKKAAAAKKKVAAKKPAKKKAAKKPAARKTTAKRPPAKKKKAAKATVTRKPTRGSTTRKGASTSKPARRVTKKPVRKKAAKKKTKTRRR